MRKKISALLAIFALSTVAHAEWLELTPHAGYSTVSMGDLNQSNQKIWAWDGGGQVEDVNSAVVAGLDACTAKLTPLNWLSLGLRAEYLQTNQAITDATVDDVYYTDQGNLSSLYLGAKISSSLSSRFNLGLAAWLGYGYAAMDQNVTQLGGGPISSGHFTGFSPVGQLEASATYKLSSRLKLSFLGGWRWANFASLQDAAGTPLYDDLKLWASGAKCPINVDFSGATAQGALSVSF